VVSLQDKCNEDLKSLVTLLDAMKSSESKGDKVLNIDEMLEIYEDCVTTLSSIAIVSIHLLGRGRAIWEVVKHKVP